MALSEQILYCLLAHRGGLELHCFCSRITDALDRIRRRKWPILICLDSALAPSKRLSAKCASATLLGPFMVGIRTPMSERNVDPPRVLITGGIFCSRPQNDFFESNDFASN